MPLVRAPVYADLYEKIAAQNTKKVNYIFLLLLKFFNFSLYLACGSGVYIQSMCETKSTIANKIFLCQLSPLLDVSEN